MARNKKRKKKTKVVKMTPRFSPEKYIKQAARKLPVKKTLISENIFESGLGQVFIVREKPNGDLVVGIYMVDVFACGVKDSIFNITDEQELNSIIDRVNESGDKLIEFDSNYTFNLIYGAVEYAEDCGIEPHNSFNLTSYILDDIDDIEYVDIEFGKDGHPLYIQGMHDNSARILAAMDKKIGPGNYDFITEADMFDDGFNEEEINILIDSLPEGWKNNYLLYVYYTIPIYEYVGGDYAKLKKQWDQDNELLINNIMIYLDETMNDEDKEAFFDSEEEVREISKEAVESILFMDGIDFLAEPQFISCFKDDEEKDIHEHINTMLFLTSGKKKINILFNLLAGMIYSWNSVKPDKYLSNPKKPYEFYKEYLSGLSGKFDDYLLPYEMNYLVDMISQYEETVKKIDKNQIGEILIVE